MVDPSGVRGVPLLTLHYCRSIRSQRIIATLVAANVSVCCRLSKASRDTRMDWALDAGQTALKPPRLPAACSQCRGLLSPPWHTARQCPIGTPGARLASAQEYLSHAKTASKVSRQCRQHPQLDHTHTHATLAPVPATLSQRKAAAGSRDEAKAAEKATNLRQVHRLHSTSTSNSM